MAVAIPRAQACSCASPPPPAAARDAAAAVFEGFVLGSVLDGQPASRMVHFQVMRSWKGVEADTVVVVHTAGNGAACGVDAPDGELMLVYATDSSSGLRMALCSRTAPSALAQEDFTALGAPAQIGVLAAGTLGSTGGAAGSMATGGAGGEPGTGRSVHSDGCAVATGRPSAAAIWIALALAIGLRSRQAPRRIRPAAESAIV